MATTDDNPRPQKRFRMSDDEQGSVAEQLQTALRPIPAPILLLWLPSLLLHPPNHHFHVPSLMTSIFAVRKCLTLQALDPNIECRAWTTLAELGFMVIAGRLHLNEANPWAKNIEVEVESSIRKGLILAQKHSSLRANRIALSILNASLSVLQHPTNTKPARTLLLRLLSTLTPTSDPPYAIYTAHLSLINLCTSGKQTKTEIAFALARVEQLLAEAQINEHAEIQLLGRVLQLQILVSAGLWDQVAVVLKQAEAALCLDFAQGTENSTGPEPPAQKSPLGDSAFEACMVIHTLILAIVFHTHVGCASATAARLALLHDRLDKGALDKFPQGFVEIQFTNSAPLTLQTTHPRVLYLLAFLVSATAKRDGVGRKPKRWIFSSEGLAAWERGLKNGLELPRWARISDIEEIERTLVTLKADLMSEVIGVSIMCSKFDEAERMLDTLIAHTRTYELFPTFAARITLHHAHLAHALGKGAQALDCYRVAAYVASQETGKNYEADFVNLAAKAGEVALRIGICASGGMDEYDGETLKEEEVRVRNMGAEVISACSGKGGTLEAVSQILEACLSNEVLKAKDHLKRALAIATESQDNHIRALILALISAHYVHTSGDHAREILKACEQLSAGLGAEVGGNAPLRLWVGERLVEVDRRTGNASRAEKQVENNRRLVVAVKRMARRGSEDIT